VLGRSPFGRWGAPVPGPARATFAEVVTVERPRRARRYRLPAESGAWVHLPGGTAARAARPLVEFDFGREVTGYLTLAVRDAETATGLLRFGSAPSRRSGWAPDEVAIVVPHRGSWQDAVPRTFRYVEVAGLDHILSASLLPLDRPGSTGWCRRAGSPGRSALRGRRSACRSPTRSGADSGKARGSSRWSRRRRRSGPPPQHEVRSQLQPPPRVSVGNTESALSASSACR